MSFAHLAIIASLAAFATAQDPCGGSEWRYSPHSGNCYQLFNMQTGWTAGEFKCVFLGGHHVSVQSANDNQFIAGNDCRLSSHFVYL